MGMISPHELPSRRPVSDEAGRERCLQYLDFAYRALRDARVAEGPVAQSLGNALLAIEGAYELLRLAEERGASA
jgi:hypothetical protein